MNETIIKEISKDLGITISQVNNTLKLLSDGNTIPFIARYRKEATNNLDEEQIKKIAEVYDYQVNLLKRKEDVIRLIDEKGLMTDELKKKILESEKLVEVEDLYRPYKEKKKTKATDAIASGLEPLAKMIMSFNISGTLEELAKPYLNDSVKTIEDALAGAKYIIAEWTSDNAYYRKFIRTNLVLNGNLVSTKKKKVDDQGMVYEMYYNHTEPIKYVKAHRVLAMNRGEKEGVLSVKVEGNKEKIITYLESKLIKDDKSIATPIVKEAIEDSYKRLIFPSVEREIRKELSEKAEVVAIDNFGKNLEKLLLQPPMKEKIVLGLDPAFRTGCKLAVIDGTGKYLDISVIYPHEPHNKKEASKKHVLDLIDKYKVDIIAIGNGTASRESEAFAADIIATATRKVEYIIVNEAGASVYSASDLAIKEFPNLHVEERSAISIARRLQDPLSELVKIDPKSIGVGLYQHDVTQKHLNESLDFVVSKAVNQVGVNVNTASPALLKYVSGLNKRPIDSIIDYREKHGRINSREELKKIKSITDKVYEQAIGFMRILDGQTILDQTSIHPESYPVTKALLQSLECTESDLGSQKLIEGLEKINLKEESTKLNIDIYTLEDIIKSLKQPGRDPRDEFEKPLLKSDILTLDDLKVGMKLQGTVRNVVDFGVFIDIGLKNDGLAHISKLTKKFIKHPTEVLSVGDIVDCYVIDINKEKKKVSLSLIEEQ